MSQYLTATTMKVHIITEVRYLDAEQRTMSHVQWRELYHARRDAPALSYVLASQ
jgi:hypothetical protein